MEPAIAWAEGGWTVRPHVGHWWAEDGQMGRAANHERLAFTPAARALYCRPDGSPKRIGDRVVNRDLGQVLRLIAKHGDEVFYEGEIAHAIVEDMRRHGGLIAPTISAGGGRCETRRSGGPTAATASRATAHPAAAPCCSRC